METNVIIKYPLDLYIKYRTYNYPLPQIFDKYKHTGIFWKKKHISSLYSSEIKVYMNQYMHKKNNEEDTILYDKIQTLLNKLSNINFDDIGNEIRELPYIKKKHIYKLCESIIIKSINEIGFSLIYAKLCHSLLPYYIIEQVKIETEIKEEKIYFRTALLTICQDIFEELTNTKNLKKSYEYERTVEYNNLGITGLMRFLAELYNCDVLNDKIINQCFINLYKLILKDNDFYDAISVFIQTFASKLNKNNLQIYNKIKNDILNLLYDGKDKIIIYENITYNFKFSKLMYKFKILEISDCFNNIEKNKSKNV